MALSPSLKRRAILFGPLVLLALSGLHSQIHYVRVSQTGEIPQASPLHLVSEMNRYRSEGLRDVVISDTSNLVLAKFQSVYINPSSATFPATDFFGNLVNFQSDRLKFVNMLVSWLYPRLEIGSRKLVEG